MSPDKQLPAVPLLLVMAVVLQHIYILLFAIVFQVADLDRKVRRGRERLEQEVEPAPPPPISAEKAEQLSVLEQKIKNLLEQVESLGEAGKVDEAEALMRKVLQIFMLLIGLSEPFPH